jgi:glycosyltransferase involved in cell wall biosynthesis
MACAETDADQEIIPMINLVYVTTVPITLTFFFHGQIGYLHRRGFDISAVSSPGDLAEQFRKDESISFYPVPMIRGLSPIADLIALWSLWRLFRRLKPDIVHSHTPKAGLLGTIAARLAGVPVVFLSVFGLRQITQTGVSRRLLDFTTWLSCLIADRIWCDSFSVRDYMVKAKLSPGRKTVVLGQGSANGVDAQGAFSPDRCGLSDRNVIRDGCAIPRNAYVLGFVGRIVKDKGMHELACVWRLLRDRYPNLHLLLVGPIESEDPLLPEDAALFHSDPRIHLTGYQRDTAAYFAAMDLFVMPSYREGFGLTNVEAAAMQLPVVSTLIPGCIDSVQDGLTGTLVPPRNTEALTVAIEKYLNDPELGHQHGVAGRQRALRDFRQETIWEALFKEYVYLLAKKGLKVSVAGELV